MNLLMDTNRNRHQYTSITLTNTMPPYLRVFGNGFACTKFDCAVKGMLFERVN